MYRARQYYIGSFLRGIETPLQVTSLVRNLDSNELDKHFYDDLYQKIAAVNLQKLRETVEKHFIDDKFVISIAGDLKSIKTQIGGTEQVQIIHIDD